jgi:hypothetical protein
MRPSFLYWTIRICLIWRSWLAERQRFHNPQPSRARQHLERVREVGHLVHIGPAFQRGFDRILVNAGAVAVRGVDQVRALQRRFDEGHGDPPVLVAVDI